MASGNWKVTFFFEGVQLAKKGASAALGWTESWYMNNNAVTIDQVFDLKDVTTYLDLRLGILPNIYRAAWIRVGDDADPRLVKVKAIDGGKGTLQSAEGVGDAQVQCALLVDLAKLPTTNLASEPSHHKRFMLRALPSTVIDGNVLNQDAVAWKQIKSFLDFIGIHETGTTVPPRKPGVNAQFLGIRYHDPNFPQVPIVGIGLHQGSVNVIDVAPDIAGAAVGSKVVVRDVPAPDKAMNRVWTVLSHNPITVGGPPWLQLGYSRKPLPSNLQTAGNISQVKWLYGTFDQYTVIGLRSKKTGRIFRQLRGRSSSRS